MMHGEPELLANETLHELIKSGIIAPYHPGSDANERGIEAAKFLDALFNGLLQMYKKA